MKFTGCLTKPTVNGKGINKTTVTQKKSVHADFFCLNHFDKIRTLFKQYKLNNKYCFEL